jgi:hypothetical protein
MSITLFVIEDPIMLYFWYHVGLSFITTQAGGDLRKKSFHS